MVLPGAIECCDADCRQVHQDNAADVPSQTDFKNALEKGSDEQKIETMVRTYFQIAPPYRQAAF
jgi:hypothetical protein